MCIDLSDGQEIWDWKGSRTSQRFLWGGLESGPYSTASLGEGEGIDSTYILEAVPNHFLV